MAETQRANPLNTPMTASYNDPVVAVDELGREIRMTRTGQRYLTTDLTPARPQATAGRGLGYNILDNIIGYDDGVDTPGERAGAAIGAIASDPIGAARGAATGIGGLIERLVGGTGTMGDVIDATGLLNLGSAAGAAPRGALRAGAGRSSAPSGFDEYLARVNPEGRSIPAEARPNLMMGDMYGMLPDNAKRVGGRDGVQFYEADGDFYATAYNPDVGEMDVVGYAIRSGDVTDLQVAGEMQGSGIGSELQYLYRRANPDAPSGGLTEAGERSLRRTYDRLVSEGLIPQSQPQTPAQRVAGLLSSGRADEVTDEMMAAVDPQEMYRLYASGATGMDLPMDEASRMARAREMGLLDDQYHATTANFLEFMPSQTGLAGRGVYSGDFATDVADYARADSSDGLNIIPLRTPPEGSYARRIDWQRIIDNDPDFPYNATVDETVAGFSRAADTMSGQGYSGVLSQPGERVTFDPRNIRSRFARFDPRLSHLSNLNAANASPLLGGAVLAAPQEQPDPLRNLRGLLAR